MKVEAGVAEVLESFSKFIEAARAAAKRHRHFDALAKIEPLETRLRRKLRLFLREIADDAAKVASQRGNRGVVANVERRELLRKVVPVRGGKCPLREIVGKTLCEKVMDAKRLEGVMKNGSVAAVFEAGQQFREGSSGLVSDARKVGSGYEVEWCLGDVQICVLSMPFRYPFGCLDAPMRIPFRCNTSTTS